MSDLEFYCWLDNEILPKGKNFTTDPHEAIKFGKDYVLYGELIVFSMNYIPESFNSTMGGDLSFPTWYENNGLFSLDNIFFDIFSPVEAVDDYQKHMDDKIISSFR